MTIEFLRSTRRTAKVRKENSKIEPLSQMLIVSTANTGNLGTFRSAGAENSFKAARSINIASLRDGTGSKISLSKQYLSVCFTEKSESNS